MFIMNKAHQYHATEPFSIRANWILHFSQLILDFKVQSIQFSMPIKKS